MGENTKIEWCDHTFNPWIGCTKIGEGCKHCYAERLNERYQWTEWGDGGQRHLTSQANWKKPYTWNRKQKKLEELDPSAALLRPKVFCASLSDVFDDHPSIKLEWQSDLMQMWHDTPYLTWLVLTKRPQNIPDKTVFPKNVWIGLSASTQHELDLMMPRIKNESIYRLFLSLEPMLGRIQLAPWHDMLHWVIVGGESGIHARPMRMDWPATAYVECKARGIPYFFKQHGAWIPRDMLNWDYLLENKINLDPLPFDNRDSPTIYIKTGKGMANEISLWDRGYMFREFPQVERSDL